MPVCSTRAFVSGGSVRVKKSVSPRVWPDASTANVRQLHSLAPVERQVTAAQLDAHDDRRIRRRSFERRRKNPHCETGRWERAAQCPEHDGGRTAIVRDDRGRWIPSRRRIASPGPYSQIRPGGSHFDSMEPPVAPVGWRIVGQHVVRAVVTDNPVECRTEVIGADHGKAVGFVRKCAQTVLGQLQLASQAAGADTRAALRLRR